MPTVPDDRASAVAAFAAWAALFPEALVLVAGDRVLGANAPATRLLQRSADELRPLPPPAWLAEPDGAWQRLLSEAARSRSLLPFALTVLRPDGVRVDCRCQAGALCPRDGDRPALLVLRLESREDADNRFLLLNQRIEQLSVEIARRRRAERDLQAYAARLRVTLGSIGDAVIATDAQGRVTLMNDVAQHLTGWALDEAAGRPLEEVFVIRNAQLGTWPESPVQRVLREGAVVGLANHTVLLTRDGRELPIDDSGAPIRDDSGRLIGVVLVFRDVSERYATERALERQARELRESDRRKDEFLSMLAHELRNPLAPLHTGLYLLERRGADGQAPDESRRTVQMMRRQLQHLTRLVDDLLDVARLTRGRIELRPGAVSLHRAVTEALEMHAHAIEQRAIRVEADLGPEDVVVHGDGTRLVQVFSNLIGNAVKFARAQGHVWVRCTVDAGHAEVAVRDDGAGIDPALLPRVFELFVQGDSSLDRARGGLGIGLTVVQAIVHLHEGSVHAHSDGLGQGACFVVRLPLGRPAWGAAPAAPP